MAGLVADRTNRSEIRDVAGRIDVSQQDEIEFMQQWLRDRSEDVPDPTAHDAMQMDHMMAGMATPEQMETLAAARGTAFDRLFLELMIAHHAGAVTMVEELHSTGGAAYEPVLFEFTNDVSNDQGAEIERMSALLAEISDDPRVGLAAGFDDAGVAIWNLDLIGSLPKPAGFFDPQNPAGLPPERPPRDDDDDEDETEADAEAGESAGEVVADANAADEDDAEEYRAAQAERER